MTTHRPEVRADGDTEVQAVAVSVGSVDSVSLSASTVDSGGAAVTVAAPGPAPTLSQPERDSEGEVQSALPPTIGHPARVDCKEDLSCAATVDSQLDYLICEHITGLSGPQGGGGSPLPEYPTCPGLGYTRHECTVTRPQLTPEFIAAFPREARLYGGVIAKGLPNYLGARLPVIHQLNIKAWREVEHHISDTQLVDFLEYGFPVGYTSSEPPTTKLPNHSSAASEPRHVEKYLRTEVGKSAMLGPCRAPPFLNWWRSNPLMMRPKRDSTDRRVILDLSFPSDASVNSAVPRNALEGSQFKMRLPNPNDLAAKIAALGPGCLLYKVDLSCAYRQLRSDPFDWPLLGVHWDTGCYTDTAIPFGLRHGASACQRTTVAVAQVAKAEVEADIEPYIDDSAGAALPDVAMLHYRGLLGIMERLGLAVAFEKCQLPLTTLTWIGVGYDSIAMIMFIEPSKIREAIELCDEFLTSSTITHKRLQKVLGKVFYVIRCTEAARRFTNRLLDLLRLAHRLNVVSITYEARLDAIWIATFLPHFNGRTVIKPSTAQRVAFVDACLQSGGGFCKDHGYFSYLFPPSICACMFTIAALEAFNLLVGVRLWAQEWHGLHVLAYSDNWASVCSINSGSASDPMIRAVIRELWWLCALHDVTLTVRHRPGAQMGTADALSRMHTSAEFRERVRLFEKSTGEQRRTVGSGLLVPPIPI